MKSVDKVLYGKFKNQSVCINDSSTAIYITPSIYYDENQVSCIIGKKTDGKANIVAWEKYEEIQEKSSMGKMVGTSALFGVVGAVVTANAEKGVKYNIVVEYIMAIIVCIAIIVVSLAVSSNDFAEDIYTHFAYGGNECNYMKLGA